MNSDDRNDFDIPMFFFFDTIQFPLPSRFPLRLSNEYIKAENSHENHSPFVNVTITGKQSAHVPHEMIKDKMEMNENYKESK